MTPRSSLPSRPTGFPPRKRVAQQLFQQTGRVALLLGLITAAAAAAIDLVVGLPIPAVHDEFANLLAADTFAEGRLTNETHPHWQHFETFHVIHQPTYQAKYPPGQALVLALGQKLGHPIVGVWIGAGAMVAAIVWMLAAFLPPPWTALGGLLIALKLGVASYWAHSYWGGALAAAGGALLVGGAGRLWAGDRPWRAGLASGLGAGILSLTRPYEGLILTFVVACWVAVLCLRRRVAPLGVSRFACAALLLGLLGVAFNGFYNDRVTGNPLTFPYQVHDAQYSLAPEWMLTAPGYEQKTYRHAVLREYHEWRLSVHEALRSASSALAMNALRLAILQGGLLGAGLLAFIALPGLVRWEPGRFALVATGVSILTVATTLAAYPHYLAPAVAPLYLLVVGGLWKTRRGGRLISARFLIPVVTILYLVDTGLQVRQLHRAPEMEWPKRRENVSTTLEASPGRDLVLLEYGPTHDVHQEWVYNRASIDRAEIVWARSMGPPADAALISYFSDRAVWRLLVDVNVRLERYTHATDRRPSSGEYGSTTP